MLQIVPKTGVRVSAGSTLLKIRHGSETCACACASCAKTEILVCAFGADSESSVALLCAQASNAQTPILVRSQSAIKMPAEVADFPLILSKYASYSNFTVTFKLNFKLTCNYKIKL